MRRSNGGDQFKIHHEKECVPSLLFWRRSLLLMTLSTLTLLFWQSGASYFILLSSRNLLILSLNSYSLFKFLHLWLFDLFPPALPSKKGVCLSSGNGLLFSSFWIYFFCSVRLVSFVVFEILGGVSLEHLASLGSGNSCRFFPSRQCSFRSLLVVLLLTYSRIQSWVFGGWSNESSIFDWPLSSSYQFSWSDRSWEGRPGAAFDSLYEHKERWWVVFLPCAVDLRRLGSCEAAWMRRRRRWRSRCCERDFFLGFFVLFFPVGCYKRRGAQEPGSVFLFFCFSVHL